MKIKNRLDLCHELLDWMDSHEEHDEVLNILDDFDYLEMDMKCHEMEIVWEHGFTNETDEGRTEELKKAYDGNRLLDENIVSPFNFNRKYWFIDDEGILVSTDEQTPYNFMNCPYIDILVDAMGDLEGDDFWGKLPQGIVDIVKNYIDEQPKTHTIKKHKRYTIKEAFEQITKDENEPIGYYVKLINENGKIALDYDDVSYKQIAFDVFPFADQEVITHYYIYPSRRTMELYLDGNLD